MYQYTRGAYHYTFISIETLTLSTDRVQHIYRNVMVKVCNLKNESTPTQYAHINHIVLSSWLKRPPVEIDWVYEHGYGRSSTHYINE